MTSTFGAYARYYDLLYADKDYAGEAAFVHRLLGKHLPTHQPADLALLDLACGTGRHSRELARLGYRVEGSDLSADMIAVARAEARDLQLDIPYHTESFQTCARLGQRYDVVIAMFSAVGYLTTPADFAAAMYGVRTLLRPGGLFVFDFWNGNAVVNDFSPERTRSSKADGLDIVRVSKTTLDLMTQTANVQFNFQITKADGCAVDRFSEQHVVRYFFPQEMTDLLHAYGYAVVHRCPFLEADRAPDTLDWNLSYLARPLPT